MAKSAIDVLLRLKGQKQFNAQVSKASRELEAMGVKGAGAMGKFARQSENLKSFGKSMTTRVTLPIVAMGGLAVKAGKDWETAFAGVRKTVDATEGEFGQLERGIRDMAMQIPVSATEIAGIAEAAGQLGIQTKNILGFTRVMADLGVATNMTSEQAASELAKFANITGMSQSNFDRLGSTIVALGNNMATTESDIVSMGMRIAGAGNQVGMSQDQIMSFAAGLSSVGIAAEAGGTAISTSFLKMNSAVLQGGDSLQGFADVAGMSADQFKSAFQQDAAGAMISFMEGLKRVKDGGGDVSEVLKGLKLSGIRVQDMMMRSAGAGDQMRKALGLGAKAWKDNNALTNEANQRYKTFDSQLQIMKNVLTEVGITFSEKILPYLTKFVEWLGPKIQGAMKTFGSLPGPVKAVAVGFVAVLAAVGPVAWALGGVAAGVGKLLIIGTKLAPVIKAIVFITRAWTAALLMNPVGLIVVGLIALAAGLVLAYKKVGWFRNAVDAVFRFLKNLIVNTVKTIVNFIRSHWKLLIAIMVGPIAVVTLLIVQNFGRIKSAAGAVVTFIKNVFSSMVHFIGSLPGKIGSAASGMFNGFTSAAKTAVNGVIDAINWMLGKLRSIHIKIPGFVPGIGGNNISFPVPGDIPHLAQGGTVTEGGRVLVGEQGPELLTLPRAASVIPLRNEQVRDAVGGQPIIHTHVYLKGREIALAVSDQMADAAAAA